MYKVKITVLRKIEHKDLMEIYENPIKNHCNMLEGQVFVCENAQIPQGFCQSAWDSVYPFVAILANGGGNFFDGWMKNEKSALISCNDGFRPVSFLLETIC